MTDTNHSPVSLPAGSYSYDELKSRLDKAAKGAAKNYDQGVADAIDQSSTNVHDPVDPRATPGYKFVDVENKDLGVTEKIQVFDPEEGAKIEESGEEAISAPDTQARRSGASTNQVVAAAGPKE